MSHQAKAIDHEVGDNSANPDACFSHTQAHSMNQQSTPATTGKPEPANSLGRIVVRPERDDLQDFGE